MKNYQREEYDWTTNSSLYNKLHKIELDLKGEIRCNLCRYHRGENDTRKFYTLNDDFIPWYKRKRMPNWKLATKNEKQWMPKNLKTREHYSNYYGYWTEIVI